MKKSLGLIISNSKREQYIIGSNQLIPFLKWSKGKNKQKTKKQNKQKVKPPDKRVMGRKNQYLDNLQQFGETDVPTQDVTSLKKYFSSLTEALDNTTSELGAGYYKTAKNKTMTLRKIKRRPLTALQDVFEKGKTLPEDEEEEEPKVEIYLLFKFIIQLIIFFFFVSFPRFHDLMIFYFTSSIFGL